MAAASLASATAAAAAGDFRSRVSGPPAMLTERTRKMPERRELYRSPNGGTWFLAREPTDGRAFIIHQPNAPSGGRLSPIDLATFLSSNANGPEHQALLRLIGTLVDVPPFANRASADAPPSST